MAPELKHALHCRADSGVSPSVGGRVFLSYADLIERGIRFSRPHLRRLENSGDFPARVELGAGNRVQTSVAWVATEIEHWQNEKIAKRDTKLRMKHAAAPAV